MFDITSSKAVVDKGKLDKVIIEFGGNPPNADIQYQEGYVDINGDFIPVGFSKVHLQDQGIEKSDFTAFISLVNVSSDITKDVQAFLLTKI